MKVLSLFSGIGGFDLALKNQGHEIVGACEIDEYARQIYATHFPGIPIHPDATKINAAELPDFDLLVAGFPCQSFSIAGNRKGFEDTRGTLFFEIARIAQEKRPRYLLLENVKGLLSHEQGATIRTIYKTLDALGYDTQSCIINTKNYLPQNRERVFIICSLRGEPRREIFPIRRNGKKTNTEINLKQIGNVDTKGHNSRWGRVYDPSGAAVALAALTGGGEKSGLYAIPTLCVNREKKRQNGRRFKEDGEPSFTINTIDQHGIYDGVRIRRLTPLECERLQGFPDGWTDILTGKNKVGLDTHMADNQRYKCCGNAVTVPVVEDIIKLLTMDVVV